MTTEAITGMQRRLRATAWIAAAVVAASTLITGLPSNGASAAGVVAATVVALALWLIAVRVEAELVVAVMLTGVGLCGAALLALRPDGPGTVVTFMAMAGLGLRVRRRLAVLGGAVVVVAAGLAEGLTANHPASGVLDIALGAGFLLLASAYAATSHESQARSLELLAQEAATHAALAEAAALAERGRLARELHDVLAHTLSGLSIQLEGARLLAEKTHADPQLTDQITQAGRLAREGMTGAKRAISTLRGDALPGPSDLPALVDNARRSGLVVAYTMTGEPRPLAGETGLAVYRSVQEALTNATKYAGAGASVTVKLQWSATAIVVEINDSGGKSVRTALPSGGFGLAGLGERAALAGGRLDAGPSDGGWRVRLEMPVVPRSEVLL